jgi:hypothetical protein
MDPDPNTTPDPTPFFMDFKDAKKFCLFIFFPYKHTRRHIIFSIKNLIFCYNFVLKNPILQALFQKGKDPDPYLRLMDPDPGGPKTCGILTKTAAKVNISYQWRGVLIYPGPARVAGL